MSTYAIAEISYRSIHETEGCDRLTAWEARGWRIEKVLRTFITGYPQHFNGVQLLMRHPDNNQQRPDVENPDPSKA